MVSSFGPSGLTFGLNWAEFQFLFEFGLSWSHYVLNGLNLVYDIVRILV